MYLPVSAAPPQDTECCWTCVAERPTCTHSRTPNTHIPIKQQLAYVVVHKTVVYTRACERSGTEMVLERSGPVSGSGTVSGGYRRRCER